MLYLLPRRVGLDGSDAMLQSPSRAWLTSGLSLMISVSPTLLGWVLVRVLYTCSSHYLQLVAA